MTLRQFNREQLKEFIDSGEYASYNILPITRQRAYSQLKNPHVLADDILLIIAISDKNEIIGFCGMLPGNIFPQKPERIFWNSCWWVDPEKGGSASMPLFFTMFKNAGQKMIFADMTPRTYTLLGKTGFFHQPDMPAGFRGYYKICLAEILPAKSTFFNRILCVLKGVDYFFNILLLPRYIVVKYKYRTKNVEYSSCQNLDNDSVNFIDNNRMMQLTVRDSADLKWIKDNPWVISQQADIEKSKKYPFSSYSKNFRIWFVKFYHQKNMIGFACFSIRNGHLKIPYVLFAKENSDKITPCIFEILSSQRDVKYFTTFHPYLAESLTSFGKNPFLFQKSVTRYFSISKSYPQFDPTTTILQDGDGDAIFT